MTAERTDPILIRDGRRVLDLLGTSFQMQA
jgi:hypothetical protein